MNTKDGGSDRIGWMLKRINGPTGHGLRSYFLEMTLQLAGIGLNHGG
jgi:hypothetical protein